MKTFPVTLLDSMWMDEVAGRFDDYTTEITCDMEDTEPKEVHSSGVNQIIYLCTCLVMTLGVFLYLN